MKLTPEHRPTVCPRCQRPFECLVDSIGQCQCQAVQLTNEQRQSIAAHYSDCLCANCLLAIQTENDAQLRQ